MCGLTPFVIFKHQSSSICLVSILYLHSRCELISKTQNVYDTKLLRKMVTTKIANSSWLIVLLGFQQKPSLELATHTKQLVYLVAELTVIKCGLHHKVLRKQKFCYGGCASEVDIFWKKLTANVQLNDQRLKLSLKIFGEAWLYLYYVQNDSYYYKHELILVSEVPST